VLFPFRLVQLATLSLLSASALAEEPLLPLPQAAPGYLGADATFGPADGRFLKPTKSIKPPAATVVGGGLAGAAPQVNAPTAARLRRLILMPGDLSPADMRQQIMAGGTGRTPVTVVGMDAPAPVLTDLAAFFGSDVNADTQKKLLDTVSKGMGAATKGPRRVEVVGWLPSEGVMAVAVYPES
jgi:hypothetical protein